MFYILDLEANLAGESRVRSVKNVTGLGEARSYLQKLSTSAPLIHNDQLLFLPPSALVCSTASVVTQELIKAGAKIDTIVVGDRGHLLIQASRRSKSLDISLHNEVDTALLCLYKGADLLQAAEVSRPYLVSAVARLLDHEGRKGAKDRSLQCQKNERWLGIRE